MLFSIIIPVYNRANLLKATIQSVLAQDYSNFEIIVVDDGSTDDVVSVVNSIPDKRIQFIKQENKERGAARNTGIKNAHGAYVSFLDSDDYVYPFFLSEAFKWLEKLNLPQVFASNFEVRTDTHIIMASGFDPNLLTLNTALITQGNIMACSGVMVRRDIALTNLFSENRTLSGSEDYELWLRLACRYPIYCSPKVSHSIIQHPDRSVLTMNPQKLINRQLTFLQLAAGNPQLTATFPNAIPFLEYEAYSYIALHLALSKKEFTKILYFLSKSLAAKPQRIFRKRTAAIIKHLLLFAF
ncbi:MAG TPA: glycosyltransferase family A protein [Chitinophagales bacterium]|nr:glycosyltransferase family A protein [Chitinophagales bacterium]HRK25883.1 glycosyltransferase family A protein [Chitinophagales bacterium]